MGRKSPKTFRGQPCCSAIFGTGPDFTLLFKTGWCVVENTLVLDHDWHYEFAVLFCRPECIRNINFVQDLGGKRFDVEANFCLCRQSRVAAESVLQSRFVFWELFCIVNIILVQGQHYRRHSRLVSVRIPTSTGQHPNFNPD